MPQHSTLVTNTDGTYTYIADPSFVGTDSFSYVVSDGTLLSDPSVITVTVQPANTAPVATGQIVTVAEDNALIIPLRTLGSDAEHDSLTLDIFLCNVFNPVDRSMLNC
jgi:hypothetical protein